MQYFDLIISHDEQSSPDKYNKERINFFIYATKKSLFIARDNFYVLLFSLSSSFDAKKRTLYEKISRVSMTSGNNKRILFCSFKAVCVEVEMYTKNKIWS